MLIDRDYSSRYYFSVPRETQSFDQRFYKSTLKKEEEKEERRNYRQIWYTN